MELAKLTSKGQITIPIDIRKKLGLKNGDKILFMEKAGKIVIMNATMAAIHEAQEAFKGLAQSVGINNDNDILNLVSDIRKEKADSNK